MNAQQIPFALLAALFSVSFVLSIAGALQRWLDPRRRYLREVREFRARNPGLGYYPTVEEARGRAEERRMQIQEVLAGLEPFQMYEREFLEVPPDRPRPETRGLRITEACSQMARLEWQLQADELLLAERVVDAIEVLFGRNLPFPESFSRVRLERLDKAGGRTTADPKICRRRNTSPGRSSSRPTNL